MKYQHILLMALLLLAVSAASALDVHVTVIYSNPAVNPTGQVSARLIGNAWRTEPPGPIAGLHIFENISVWNGGNTVEAWVVKGDHTWSATTPVTYPVTYITVYCSEFTVPGNEDEPETP